MSDLELVDRLKQRDESALVDLIDIYGDLIYRAYNKILNNKELSEECLFKYSSYEDMGWYRAI